MAPSFYRIGLVIGFGFAFLLVGGYLRLRTFEVLRWEYFVPVASAALAGYLVSYKIDTSSYGRHTSLFWVVSLGLLIFLIGALVGCIANFLINGYFLNSSGSPIGLEAWLIRPFLWLCSAGVPASILIALVYRYYVLREN